MVTGSRPEYTPGKNMQELAPGIPKLARKVEIYWRPPPTITCAKAAEGRALQPHGARSLLSPNSWAHFCCGFFQHADGSTSARRTAGMGREMVVIKVDM